VRRIVLLVTLTLALLATTIGPTLAAEAPETLPNQACGSSKGGPGGMPKSSPSPVVFGDDEAGGIRFQCALIAPPPEQ
jgi:hypothetical protein